VGCVSFFLCLQYSYIGLRKIKSQFIGMFAPGYPPRCVGSIKVITGMMEFALRETKFSMVSLISSLSRVVRRYVLLVYVIKGKSLVLDKRFSVKSCLVRKVVW